MDEADDGSDRYIAARQLRRGVYCQLLPETASGKVKARNTRTRSPCSSGALTPVWETWSINAGPTLISPLSLSPPPSHSLSHTLSVSLSRSLYRGFVDKKELGAPGQPSNEMEYLNIFQSLKIRKPSWENTTIIKDTRCSRKAMRQLVVANGARCEKTDFLIEKRPAYLFLYLFHRCQSQ